MPYLEFSIHLVSLAPYFIDDNKTFTESESYTLYVNISKSNELNALFNDQFMLYS